MIDKKEVANAILLLEKYPETFAWADFEDRGSSCIGKFEDGVEESINLGTVKLLIPKGSKLHINLNNSVARMLDLTYVTYDWLIKIISRIISSCSFNNFVAMIQLSLTVRKKMQEKGLKQINSLAEVL